MLLFRVDNFSSKQLFACKRKGEKAEKIYSASIIFSEIFFEGKKPSIRFEASAYTYTYAI